MAKITCFSETNFQGYSKQYTSDQSDLTIDFPKGIHSAIVEKNPVTVFHGIGYQPPSAQLVVDKYPDVTRFPDGSFKSLKVE